MKKKQKKISYYFDFSELLNYFFRNRDNDTKTNFSIRAMHRVNRIAISMFIIGIILWIIKRLDFELF
tara:strand:- start:265 stop:465 length:201 start_codon:yes stop_codon:yes gene_type:complete